MEYDFLNDAASISSAWDIPTASYAGPDLSSTDFSMPSAAVSASDFSFTDIGNFIKSGVDWGLGVQQTIANVRGAAEDTEFNRMMRSLELDTRVNQAKTNNEILKAKSASELAIAKARESAAQGVANVASGGGNSTMLLLTLLGVGFAAMTLLKGK